MANDAIEVPLRAGGGWSGISDTSELEPSPGLFRRLENVYINRDGTELRRAPGCRPSGYPGHCQAYDITAMTTGSQTAVTLDVGDILSAFVGPTLVVYVTGNGVIPDGTYYTQRVSSTQISIEYDSTGESSNLDGSVLVQRAGEIHALTHADNRIVSVCETSVFDVAGNRQRFNVGSSVSSDRLSFSSPAYPAPPSATDDDFVFWPSPTMIPINDSGDLDPATVNDISGAVNMDIVRRMQVDAQRGVVAIAVPGWGCLFQVNVRTGPPLFDVRPPNISGVNIPDHRFTKALGIHRPVFPQTRDNQRSASATASSPGGTLAANFYAVSAAFYDPFTQEVGLAAERIIVRATSASSQIDITLPYPRSVMLESAGLGVVVYMSEEFASSDGALAGVLYPFSYAGPFNPENDKHLSTDRISITITSLPDTEDDRFPGRETILEQMHPGGSWVRYCKNRLFAGGAYPDFHELDVFLYRNDPTGGERDRFFLNHPDERAVSGVFNDSGPLAMGRVPHALAGYLWAAASLFGSPPPIGTSLQTAGGRDDTAPVAFTGLQATEITFEVGESSIVAGNERPVRVYNRPDIISFSEEAFPGVSPSTNRLTIDSLHTNRVMASARVGDALVSMTEYETILYSWNTAPRTSSAARVSTQYGCIAPGSVVEGPFGAAWFSHEGPVLFTGSVQWIGRQIRELFATFKRDSNGHMYNVVGAVDLDRDMVVWAVRGPDDEDGEFAGASTDAEKAKLPNDLLLLWNFRTGGYTTVKRTVGSNVSAISYLPYDDGRMRLTIQDRVRTFALTGITSGSPRVDHLLCPLYGWDETSADRAENVTELTIASDRAANASQIVVSSGADILYALDQIYVREAKTGRLAWFGRVKYEQNRNSDTLINIESGDADGASWKAGDTVVCGVQHMHIETNSLRFDDLEHDNECTGLAIRADVPSGTEAWARVRLEREDGQQVLLCVNRWGDTLYDGVTNFDYGNMRAQGMRVLIDIVSNGQVRVKDISLKVQGG